jgi:hypothetical protein
MPGLMEKTTSEADWVVHLDGSVTAAENGA